ncbi:hypothetical protein GLOTRDRAFT_129730 [Gloeophyllum trabeum ATCC 11539]|uniref:Uncharacterized protein n=1 Tax=Gloeophyllum trabeum (strain ATCC 11539 / FP-39264 / Madison 617) TaxID=670483 RepID=S7Q5W9_GLOTA|nr:uncharacterized protein GLOTRDRAFT_129730 [Gloeophyllum trabeum ATCC 11539]EPQ55456.1 hypothetical protein GLOTRDRAFT_129730 [Gloeophyllum trabeum ATCC 11539]
MDIQFTESAYAQKFDAQLTALETFDFKTKDLDVVARIRVNLLKHARSCAKVTVPETNEGDARPLVNDDYATARREWELHGVEYDSE